jgi:N-acetylmuramoyl-L-alanine amidase
MKRIYLSLLFISFLSAYAQENPFVKLVNPLRENNTVTAARQFLIGSTCKTCVVTVNNLPAKVWPTGAIAFEVNLPEGDTSYMITASNPAGKSVTKTVKFNYTKAKAAIPVSALQIESIQTLPAGNLVLMAGDKIQFAVKALPGSNVTTINGTVLYEMPLSQTRGMAGIYKGEYTIKPTDNFSAMKIPVTLTADDGNKRAIPLVILLPLNNPSYVMISLRLLKKIIQTK